MDTIFARSSGAGKAGIVVFRISGPKSLGLLNKLLGNTARANITPSKMYYKKLYVPDTLELIDNAMVVFFKAPTSFTGEDTVELHLHGSIAITKLIYETLGKIEGLRIAENGEFAKRAFFNGKFDLTSAEGLADLIEAETILQHKQAIKQLDGNLVDLYEKWRKQALHIISFLEAYIDFPEEEIPTEVLQQTQIIANELNIAINNHLNDGKKGERLRNGIKVCIIGAPNVGKSSLLNFLLQREAAIVSNIPGTTRDIIEGHLDIAGYPIILQDTAGIRDNSLDFIEKEGIKRALSTANVSDLIIYVKSAEDKQEEDFISQLNHANIITVINKIDVISEQEVAILLQKKEDVYISLKKSHGLDTLIDKIILEASNLINIVDEPQITRARYRQQLNIALQHLNNFQNNNDLILACEDIRLTTRALASITGIITVEEILGEIFNNFCIGK